MNCAWAAYEQASRQIVPDASQHSERSGDATGVSQFKSKSRLEAENAALRHQLIVLQRTVRGRVHLTNGDRLFFSPWQNGFAERLIGSIRRECADHVVVLGEAHLRAMGLSRIPMGRNRCVTAVPSALLALHSVHPVGVRQHVEAHQSKDNEHNHGGHDPHYAHFGFFFLLILVCHGFLLFCSRPLLSPLLGAAATLQVI
jgi:hypothetical protein